MWVKKKLPSPPGILVRNYGRSTYMSKRVKALNSVSCTTQHICQIQHICRVAITKTQQICLDASTTLIS